MTCNDLDCIMQQVAALDAAALVKIALWMPVAVYGIHLSYRFHCEDLELRERYRIGLENRPDYYVLRYPMKMLIIVFIIWIALMITYKIIDFSLPEDFSRLQPLKWIL